MRFTHNANGSCGFSGWSALGFRRSLEHTSYPRAACFGGSQRVRRRLRESAGTRKEKAIPPWDPETSDRHDARGPWDGARPDRPHHCGDK